MQIHIEQPCDSIMPGYLCIGFILYFIKKPWFILLYLRNFTNFFNRFKEVMKNTSIFNKEKFYICFQILINYNLMVFEILNFVVLLLNYMTILFQKNIEKEKQLNIFLNVYVFPIQLFLMWSYSLPIISLSLSIILYLQTVCYYKQSLLLYCLL